MGKNEMKTRLLLLFFLPVIQQTTLAQHRTAYFYKSHGTVVIMMEKNDTIIAVADSRQAYTCSDEASDVVGYSDSMPKIYAIGNFILAVIGTGSIDDKPVGKIIADFKIQNRAQSFKTGIYGFEAYLDRMFPLSKYPISRHNMFIAGGFVNNKPVIVKFDRGNHKLNDSFFRYMPGGMLSNDDERIVPLVKDMRIKYWFDCARIGRWLSTAIDTYAKKFNLQKYVGGPCSVAFMCRNNRVVWSQNNFANHEILNTKDFYNKLLKDEIKFYPVRPGGKEDYLYFMKHGTKRPH